MCKYFKLIIRYVYFNPSPNFFFFPKQRPTSIGYILVAEIEQSADLRAYLRYG
jgi:hypothetical protein